MTGNGGARFPSTMRLKRKTDIIRVFREGTPWKGSCFSLHVLPRAGDEQTAHQDAVSQEEDAVPPPETWPRLGLVVTKRVGSAVERNRIKRRIREAFRKIARRLPAVDILVRPDAACVEMPEEEISRSLVHAVNKALGNMKERT
jgi:ribonuclease P protein component